MRLLHFLFFLFPGIISNISNIFSLELFRRLSRADMVGVVTIQLQHLEKLLADRKITIVLDEEARAWLAQARRVDVQVDSVQEPLLATL
jgi:ATP-dependent Clp protease ATP-binding subunit ClpA